MKKFLFFVIFILTCSTFLTTSVVALPVFPGAKGFGSTTLAGRGGAVYKVTNLNDSGAGSLRACIEASGPRVCVFEVSGNIELKSSLSIKNPYVTIAGQTAPSPGITLTEAQFIIEADDILVQHIRVRLGDTRSGERDTARISSGAKNVIVDHCSFSWGVDGTFDVVYGANNISIINSIFSETLDNSIHPEGRHSRAVLVSRAHNISIIDSLWVSNDRRHPGIDTKDDYIGYCFVSNCLMYNYGRSGATITSSKAKVGNLKAALVKNVFKEGPDTSVSKPIGVYGSNEPRVYIEGNLCLKKNGGEESFQPNLLYDNSNGEIIFNNPPPSFWPNDYIPMDVNLVEEYVLSNAGARPADRDIVDERIINEVISKTGRIIDSQDDVGGWPSLAENKRELTLPANPNGDDDGDGYTNLEEWLHEFAAEVEGGGDTIPQHPTNFRIPGTLPVF